MLRSECREAWTDLELLGSKDGDHVTCPGPGLNEANSDFLLVTTLGEFDLQKRSNIG